MFVPLVGRAAIVTEQNIFKGAGPAIYKQALLASDGLVDDKVIVMDDGVGPCVPYLVGPKEVAGHISLGPRLGITAFMQITFNGDNISDVFLKHSNKG